MRRTQLYPRLGVRHSKYSSSVKTWPLFFAGYQSISIVPSTWYSTYPPLLSWITCAYSWLNEFGSFQPIRSTSRCLPCASMTGLKMTIRTRGATVGRPANAKSENQVATLRKRITKTTRPAVDLAPVAPQRRSGIYELEPSSELGAAPNWIAGGLMVVPRETLKPAFHFLAA